MAEPCPVLSGSDVRSGSRDHIIKHRMNCSLPFFATAMSRPSLPGPISYIPHPCIDCCAKTLEPESSGMRGEAHERTWAVPPVPTAPHPRSLPCHRQCGPHRARGRRSKLHGRIQDRGSARRPSSPSGRATIYLRDAASREAGPAPAGHLRAAETPSERDEDGAAQGGEQHRGVQANMYA